MQFTHWKEYFLRNQDHFADIDLSVDDRLTAAEKKIITSSLQQFQKGESSEGKHLFLFAKAFSDPSYLECIKLFIPEEQTHAAVLKAFMNKHDIPIIRNHWVDGVFRWLRKLGGIANTVRVLLIAEVIAKIYYRALHSATGSVLLKKICEQILDDEDSHIRFQCEALHIFYQKKPVLYRLFIHWWQLTLMCGTIVVVWTHHRKVLSAGGLSFFSFIQKTLSLFFQSERIIQKRFVSGNEATLFT
jgi:hypothetical protein